MSITYRDIQNLENRDGYEGYGYFGHSQRNCLTDVMLANAVGQSPELTLDDAFGWANSKLGRWFMDGFTPETTTLEFYVEITKHIDDIRSW